MKELLSHNNTRAFLGGVRRLPTSFGDWVKDTFDEAEFEGAKVKFKEAIHGGLE